MSDQGKMSKMEEIWSKGDYRKLGLEHQIISERLVEHTVIRAGQKVLDIACGSGNTAIAVARRRAAVTGIDVSAALLTQAQTRADAEGVDGITWDRADATRGLPYEDDAFDCVLSTLGVSFFPDHEAIMNEMLRVTRPCGTIGITAWAEASMPSDFFHLSRDLGIVPEGKDVKPAYYFCRGDYMADLAGDRGSDIRFINGEFEACYASIDDYLDILGSTHGPTIARLSALAEDIKEDYRDNQRKILKRYNRATDGTFACLYNYVEIIMRKA
ncbi:methyltransferase domain-containing protein [Agrobacterium vitis]|uniref:Methyltransferase domain-containing protein n=1 Tax=Agrobacterium vitis TaxID=373 RepID=A0A6L6VJK7_AGRVI|nr:class I SAM-dependent methyltransferase [Agrobacterium vitis]MUZ76013.1 methyltransferase domain-containing protein [Agrobacterium vitis]